MVELVYFLSVQNFLFITRFVKINVKSPHNQSDTDMRKLFLHLAPMYQTTDKVPTTFPRNIKCLQEIFS